MTERRIIACAFSCQKKEDRGTKYRNDGYYPDYEVPVKTVKGNASLSDLGKPRLMIKGHELNSIPGVSKGFVGSTASALSGSAMQNLFTRNDRVRHPKFGFGRVIEVSGTGSQARIRIRFDTAGEKELALSIAPIVKVEEET